MVPVFENVKERAVAKNYWAFIRSRATPAVTLDIYKTLNRVLHAGLLHKLKSCEISGQIFGLTLPFLSNRWL